jgi:hypothetical protein
MQAQVVDHGILLAFSAFDHRENFAGKAVRQFLVFQAFPVAPTAIADNQIDVVGRDVPAADITVVITFSVKRTNYIMSHDSLKCKNRKVGDPQGKSEGQVVTVPLTSAYDPRSNCRSY